jgi:hypothetical protein
VYSKWLDRARPSRLPLYLPFYHLPYCNFLPSFLPPSLLLPIYFSPSSAVVACLAGIYLVE